MQTSKRHTYCCSRILQVVFRVLVCVPLLHTLVKEMVFQAKNIISNAISMLVTCSVCSIFIALLFCKYCYTVNLAVYNVSFMARKANYSAMHEHYKRIPDNDVQYSKSYTDCCWCMRILSGSDAEDVPPPQSAQVLGEGHVKIPFIPAAGRRSLFLHTLCCEVAEALRNERSSRSQTGAMHKMLKLYGVRG